MEKKNDEGKTMSEMKKQWTPRHENWNAEQKILRYVR